MTKKTTKTTDWIYADLVGIAFRYSEKANLVQRLYIYKEGWESLSSEKVGPDIIKEIKEQQDLTRNSYYQLFGVAPRGYYEATDWLTVPKNLRTADGMLVRVKLLGRVGRPQLEALSGLPQPVKILGGRTYEGKSIFVAVPPDGMYLVEKDGTIRDWLQRGTIVKLE